MFALAANSTAALLAEQAAAWKPAFVGLVNGMGNGEDGVGAVGRERGYVTVAVRAGELPGRGLAGEPDRGRVREGRHGLFLSLL